MLAPDDPFVQVIVNGRRVKGLVVVEASDTVRIRCRIEAPETRVAIDVAPDEMEARLVLSYRPGTRRFVLPTEPSLLLTIDPVVVPIEPVPATLAHVRAELTRHGIVAGLIDSAVIQAFLDRRESGSWLIARGQPPQPGLDPWQAEPAASGPGPWYVEPGQIIARRHADPARGGYTVRGSPALPTEQPGQTIVQCGPGVTVMAHRAHFVATRAGLVVLRPDVVDVIPQWEWATVEAGPDPLVVDGDLVVKGTVAARPLIVTGNLSVQGDILGADVVVGGSLTVSGSVKDAVITMGIDRYAHRLATEHLQRAIDGLYDLEATLHELEPRVGDRLATILRQVIPRKFGDVLDSLAWLVQATEWPTLTWDAGFKRTIRQVDATLSPTGLSELTSTSPLWAWRDELEAIDGTDLVHLRPQGRQVGVAYFHTVERSHIDSPSAVIYTKAHQSTIISHKRTEQETITEVWPQMH